MKWLWQEILKWLIKKSSPRLSGSKRTTFRGAKRRCKSEWDALPLAKVAASAVERGKLEQKRKKILTCVRKLAPIASQGSALPSEFGDSKRPRKKEIIVFKIFTHTHLTISYAGFFAKSQIIFFHPSSFRHCPSLKNDGTGEFAFEKQ